MKILLYTLILLTLSAAAQTAAVKPLQGATRSTTTTPTSFNCAVTGKTSRCTNIALPIPSIAVDVPGQTADVNLSGFTGKVSCPSVTITKDAKGNQVIDLGKCMVVK